MPHSPEEKKRALSRVRRIKGQVMALERSLEDGEECLAVLQQIAAVRGAVNGLMTSVIEAHIRETFGQEEPDAALRAQEVQALNEIIRSYLK